METTANSLPEGFWGTMMPYAIIVVLLIIATVACYLPLRSRPLKNMAAVGIPILIMAAAFIEISLFSKLGKNVVWWCDLDKVGFFSAFFRLFPFVLMLALQFHSFFAYQNFIFGPQMLNDPQASISLKPKAKGFWWLLLVVVLAGVADKIGLKGDLLNLVIGIAFMGVLFMIVGWRNFERFGLGWGAAVTFFAVVYIIGFLLASYGFLMALIKVFWQMLIWTAFAIVGWIAFSKTPEEIAYEKKRRKEEQEQEWRRELSRRSSSGS